MVALLDRVTLPKGYESGKDRQRHTPNSLTLRDKREFSRPVSFSQAHTLKPALLRASFRVLMPEK
jgi:hypothetical protein